MIIHMFTSPPTHLTSPAGLLAGPSSNPGMPAVGTEAIDDVQLRCATRGRVNVVSGPCREESKATTNSLSGQGSGLGRGKRRASFLKVRMKRSGTSDACSRFATLPRIGHLDWSAADCNGVWPPRQSARSRHRASSTSVSSFRASITASCSLLLIVISFYLVQYARKLAAGALVAAL